MKIAEVKVRERQHPKMRFWQFPNGRSKPLRRDYNSDCAEYDQTTRVYVWPKNENILENLTNRQNRPYKEYKRLVEKELEDAGYECKVRWSQKAGCKMCPCSPGFVLDKTIYGEDNRPVDIHITVE